MNQALVVVEAAIQIKSIERALMPLIKQVSKSSIFHNKYWKKVKMGHLIMNSHSNNVCSARVSENDLTACLLLLNCDHDSSPNPSDWERVFTLAPSHVVESLDLRQKPHVFIYFSWFVSVVLRHYIFRATCVTTLRRNKININAILRPSLSFAINWKTQTHFSDMQVICLHITAQAVQN